MERELVELQVALQVEQQANEGLAEGAGTDDVDDAFGTHLVSSSRWRGCTLQGSDAHCTEGTAEKGRQRRAGREIASAGGERSRLPPRAGPAPGSPTHHAWQSHGRRSLVTPRNIPFH